jgi:hypothetical protein
MRNSLLKMFYPNHIKFALKDVQELINQDWDVVVGGSLALYLQGKKLKRFNNWTGDIDLIVTGKGTFKIEETKDLPSGCDFELQGVHKKRKVDIRVDPKATYNTVIYDGFMYNVSVLEDIITAKRRYAREKDINDLKELGL